MKAIVVHEYGGPDVLKWEEFPDPVAQAGEVLVKVAATSINPVDYKRRSGAAKGMFPIGFPGIIGVDVAGTVEALGPGVEGFSVGDRVFGMAPQSYAQRVAVPAAALAKIPHAIDVVDAAAIPLVAITGSDLITAGTDIQAGQTVLVTGAAGMVGRTAVYVAKQRGATVIAGVRQKQVEEAKALGADAVLALDDENAVAALSPVDAVADAVGGKTADALLAKVKPGGVFASVLGPPSKAGDYPALKIVPVQAKPDAELLLRLAQAVQAGALSLPISERLPLSEAAHGHELAEKGGVGKILLVA